MENDRLKTVREFAEKRWEEIQKVSKNLEEPDEFFMSYPNQMFLSPEDFEKFVDMISNPPEFNPALKQALENHSKMIGNNDE